MFEVFLTIFSPVLRLIAKVAPRLALAISLLFDKNRFAYWAIAVHESGNFTNSNSTERNNYFNFAWVGHWLQKKKGVSTAPGEPIFAYYYSPAQSLMHVRDWFERNQKTYQALSDFSNEKSMEAAVLLSKAMQERNYFTASLGTYANALYYSAKNYPYPSALSILGFLLLLCVPLGTITLIYWLLTRIVLNFR